MRFINVFLLALTLTISMTQVSQALPLTTDEAIMEPQFGSGVTAADIATTENPYNSAMSDEPLGQIQKRDNKLLALFIKYFPKESVEAANSVPKFAHELSYNVGNIVGSSL